MFTMTQRATNRLSYFTTVVVMMLCVAFFSLWQEQRAAHEDTLKNRTTTVAGHEKTHRLIEELKKEIRETP